MKIVCILGSPHGVEGNTFKLLERVLEGTRQEGSDEVLIVPLESGIVLPCRGCDTCHRLGSCPQEDGFDQVIQSIEEADGVILASPNYLGSVTAQMKAFMDRCCGKIHCLSFAGRYGASVVTSGGGDDEAVVAFMNRLLLMTGIHPVGGVHAAMASMPESGFSAAVREQAENLGASLVQAWREQRTDPETDQQINAFRERMRQLIVWKKEEWPYEYSYWQEHHGTA
jgi:multimeric flavodoxin WrbA